MNLTPPTGHDGQGSLHSAPTRASSAGLGVHVLGGMFILPGAWRT